MNQARVLLRPRILGLLALTAATVVPAWSYSPVRPPWIDEVFPGDELDDLPTNAQFVVFWGRSSGGPGLHLWDAEGRPVPIEREILEGDHTRLVPTEPLAPGAYQLASRFGHPVGAVDTATSEASGDAPEPESGDTSDTVDTWQDPYTRDTSETGSYRRPGRWGEGLWFTVVDEVDEQPPEAPVIADAYLVDVTVQEDTGFSAETYTVEVLFLELEDPSEPVIAHTSFLRDGMSAWEANDMEVLFEADVIRVGLEGKAPIGAVEVTYLDRAGNVSPTTTIPLDPSMNRESGSDLAAGCGASGSEAVSGGCQQGTGPSGLGILGFATLLGLRRRSRPRRHERSSC